MPNCYYIETERDQETVRRALNEVDPGFRHVTKNRHGFILTESLISDIWNFTCGYEQDDDDEDVNRVTWGELTPEQQRMFTVRFAGFLETCTSDFDPAEALDQKYFPGIYIGR